MNQSRIAVVVAVFAIAAIVGLGWLLGISPKLAEADAASQETTQVEQQNLAQQAAIAKLRSQFNDLGALDEQLAVLQVAIPNLPDAQAFVAQLNSDAAQAGVRIMSVAISEAVLGASGGSGAPAPAPAPSATPAPAAAPAAGGTAVTDTGSGQLYSIPVVISVQGSSSQVVAFTKLVQGGPRYFLATAMSFQKLESLPGGTVSGLLFAIPGVHATSAPGSPAAPATTPTPTVGPTAPASPTPTP